MIGFLEQSRVFRLLLWLEQCDHLRDLCLEASLVLNRAGIGNLTVIGHVRPVYGNSETVQFVTEIAHDVSHLLFGFRHHSDAERQIEEYLCPIGGIHHVRSSFLLIYPDFQVATHTERCSPLEDIVL